MMKAHVITFGCQMNVYDSGRIMDMLVHEGYQETDSPNDADIVIMNTCFIREKPSEKVFSELGKLRLIKERKKKSGQPFIIGVAGCVAKALGEDILKRAKFVDFVVGPQNYHLIPSMLQDKINLSVEIPETQKFDHLPVPSRNAYAPYLTIQEGCNRFCSYCVVPFTRGREYSRPMPEIIDEAKALIDKGAKSIMLLGQNVNAYKYGLAKLIETLAKLDGLSIIRYTTSYPSNLTDDIIIAHRDIAKLAPYLHLPIQSGSDKVLKAMNRKYTVAEYLNLVEKLRSARPDIALSSDFIVGFPGETETDFKETLAVVEQVGFAHSYSFKFSARPHTKAFEMEQMAEEIKDERLYVLQQLLDKQQTKYNSPFKGRIMPVLIEEHDQKTNQLKGLSPYMHRVNIPFTSDLQGSIVMVKIGKVGRNSLTGEVHFEQKEA